MRMDDIDITEDRTLDLYFHTRLVKTISGTKVKDTSHINIQF